MVTLNILLSAIVVFSLYVFSDCEECGLQGIICRNKNKYRSISGSCNNLKHPNWGTTGSTYDRFLPPKYGPNDDLPLAISGNPLPNARTLSQNIFTDKTMPDKHVTLNCMQYGQFITHDLSFNSLANAPIACCTLNMQELEIPLDICRSVIVPPNDKYYSFDNVTCISVVKTLTNRDLNCSNHLNYTEQLSATNSFLDLSIIYGATNEDHNSLRTFENGTLLVDERDGYEWLPHSDVFCPFNNPNERCYRTADSRVNQNPQLTVLHIMWVREHNRIARELKKLNPFWNDEKIFQEARRIAIAEHQYITYYELLPLYLGEEIMLKYKLIYEEDGFIDDYDEDMMPHVFNEHAQAAFRHFHGMVSGRLDLVDEERCPYRSVNLRDTLGRPHFIEQRDNFDSLSRGMNSQPSITSDIFVVPEMSTFAFLIFKKTGFDIKSIDIQRARVHGLCSYNDMRELVGLGRAEFFDDFLDVMDRERVELLRNNYECPEDVDLLVGGNLERKIQGSLAGTTFLYIMLQQFFKTRKSDRFWFESEECGFDYDQLREIKKSSIAKLFCDNGNSINSMQEHGFLQVSTSNPLKSCELIDGPNLEYWRKSRKIIPTW